MKLKPIYNQIVEDSLSANASRLKTSNKHVFEPPIDGLNGNQLISYEWAWKGGEKFSKHDGGLVATRVSDWDRALSSAETGKDLVHQFTVKTDHGEKVVSAESVVHVLGFADKKATGQMPSLVNAVKTLAKLQMQYKAAFTLKQEYKSAKREIEDNMPKFTVDNIEYRDDGSVERFDVHYNGKTFKQSCFDRKVKSKEDFDRVENGMHSMNDRIKENIIDKEIDAIFGKIPYGAMVTTELESKIKKQEQKIQNLSKQHNRDI